MGQRSALAAAPTFAVFRLSPPRKLAPLCGFSQNHLSLFLSLIFGLSQQLDSPQDLMSNGLDSRSELPRPSPRPSYLEKRNNSGCSRASIACARVPVSKLAKREPKGGSYFLAVRRTEGFPHRFPALVRPPASKLNMEWNSSRFWHFALCVTLEKFLLLLLHRNMASIEMNGPPSFQGERRERESERVKI